MRRLPFVLLLLLALLTGLGLGWEMGGPPDLGRWGAAIRRAAARARIDAALLEAMVAVESGGRPRARSRRGARGLLQLLPATAQAEARHLGLASVDLDDPETNLILGAAHLRRLLDRYDGSVFFALAAYNAGPTALERWRRRAPNLDARTVVMREGYDETRMYVARVLAWYRHYRGGS